MTTLNKTESRLTALREVQAGKISYDPRSGTYFDAAALPVSGARRRTFAELRAAGVIDGDAPVVTTPAGDKLIEDWS